VPPVPIARRAAGAHRTTWLREHAPPLVGLALPIVAFVAFLLSDRDFNAGHGDFFYLADAFLHGRTWLLLPLGAFDAVVVGSRVYVPYAPFPALVVLPLVALVGPQRADTWQPIVNAALAALDVWLVWALAGRIGVHRLIDRVWLAVLFGFSTQLWWVTARGGVWHTGHLVASALSLVALIELFGRRRMLMVGLVGGAAFLSRAPILFAMPFYGLWALLRRSRPSAVAAASPSRIRRFAAALPVRDWAYLVIGAMPALAFYLWYNATRFGSPLESGYEMASLPAFLEAQRRQGLFSVVHLGRNLDYLLWHLPQLIDGPPFIRPDGLGLSIFITSPALLLAVRAPWRDRRSWLLVGAFVCTLIPSLLYYGGGWFQFGYRYALDAIPFAVALCAMGVAARGGLGLGWRILIVAGVVVNGVGAYWATHL
jgi:hypothetical protein